MAPRSGGAVWLSPGTIASSNDASIRVGQCLDLVSRER